MVPHLYRWICIFGFMILQKQKAREYKGKSIYKYTLVVPPQDIEQLRWDKGTELQGNVVKDCGYFLSIKK